MPHEIATRRVLYEIPGMNAIEPREFEFPGSDGQPLSGRMYLPRLGEGSGEAGSKAAQKPSRLPKQVQAAIDAARDKKATDVIRENPS